MRIDAREEPKEQFGGKWMWHPKTQEPLDPEDTDTVIEAIAFIDDFLKKMYQHRDALADVLIKKVAHLKTKSRIAKGETREAEITMPDDRQDGAALKAIAENAKFKVIWPQLIRISQYSIKKRELATALKTEGTKEWNEYRDKVKAAILPPTARPRVKVKK